MAVVLALAGQEPKLPVPDAAAQKDAEKTIREVFKDQYGRPTLADRQALARELLQQAEAADNPPAVRYVLLRDAQSFGDLETSAKATEQMSRYFVVNVLAMKLKTLNLSIPKSPDEFKPLAEQYLALADEALQAGDVDVADTAAKAALANVRKAKEVPLQTRVQAKVKEIADFRNRLEAVRKAEAALLRDPNDPAANGVVGLHECLILGNWDKGLPMLVKGDAPALKAAATTDLTEPSETAKQIEAGDAWWALAEKEPGSAKSRLRARALHWYGKAMDKATGLVKLKLESRFQETGQTPKGPAAARGPFPLADRGFIRHWLLLGPFPNVDDKGLETEHLSPEKLAAAADGREVDGVGRKLKWVAYAAPADLIDFGDAGICRNEPDVTVYAVCWITVEKDQKLQIRTASDDGCYIWVDNRLTGKHHVHEGVLPDRYLDPVTLTRGKHFVVIKVENGGGLHQFMLRVTSPAGEKPAGIQVWNSP